MSGIAVASLKPEALTWDLAVRLFMLRCKAQNLSPSTVDLYGYALKGFRASLDANGAPRPSEAQSHHVRAYLEECQKNMASETVEARYRQIRTFLRFLSREGLLLKDPIEGVAKPRKVRRLVKPFTVDQFKAVLSQIDTKNVLGMRDKALILLLADTGLRISEAVSLKIGQLDLANNSAVVMGKGSKERRVCWGEAARRTLLAWLRARPSARDGDPVFCNRYGEPLKRSHFEHRLKAYTGSAGLVGMRLSAHALRHMFALQFLKGGGDVMTLQRLLGHSTLEMTRRYLNMSDDEVLQRAKAVGVVDRLGAMPGDKRRVIVS